VTSGKVGGADSLCEAAFGGLSLVYSVDLQGKDADLCEDADGEDYHP
jgi:hypothetical protein